MTTARLHDRYPELGRGPIPVAPYIDPAYYELEKNGFLQSIKQRAIVAGISRDIAYEGLKVLPGNDRLKALGDAYGFLADQLPRLIDKYTKSHL